MVPNPIATEVVFFLENHYGLPWNENSNKSYSDSNPPFLQVQGGFFVAAPMFSPQLYQCSARQVPQRLRHTMLTKASTAPRQRRPHATRGAA